MDYDVTTDQQAIKTSTTNTTSTTSTTGNAGRSPTDASAVSGLPQTTTNNDSLSITNTSSSSNIDRAQTTNNSGITAFQTSDAVNAVLNTLGNRNLSSSNNSIQQSTLVDTNNTDGEEAIGPNVSPSILSSLSDQKQQISN